MPILSQDALCARPVGLVLDAPWMRTSDLWARDQERGATDQQERTNAESTG
jgi:hypothetical protein